MRPHIHLPDSGAFADLHELIDLYGESAEREAARRAGHSRTLGNIVHYCRWRQIERMIALLSGGRADSTLH